MVTAQVVRRVDQVSNVRGEVGISGIAIGSAETGEVEARDRDAEPGQCLRDPRGTGALHVKQCANSADARGLSSRRSTRPVSRSLAIRRNRRAQRACVGLLPSMGNRLRLKQKPGGEATTFPGAGGATSPAARLIVCAEGQRPHLFILLQLCLREGGMPRPARWVSDLIPFSSLDRCPP